MNNKTRNKFFILMIITIALLFGYTNDAKAQVEITAPNPGDPIAVDGDISDWDLIDDFYYEMYRYPSNDIHEANAYLRYHYDPLTSTGMMYLLVLTTSQTPNIVPNPSVTLVRINGAIPSPFDLVFVNVQGNFAQGWEASFPISHGLHTFFVESRVQNGGEFWAKFPGYTLKLGVFAYDYGDLPDSYATYESSNGPKHTAGPLRLGPQVDGESDGQPGTDPIQDDINGRNDEDGVEAIGNWLNSDPQVRYEVNGCTGTCFLNAWVDWGNDGGFDLPSDILFTSMPVTNGTFVYEFPIPSGISFPSTFNVRFRLCDSADGCSSPFDTTPTGGLAPFGEVEDYQWSFRPNAVTINSFTATPTQNSTALYLIAGSAAGIFFASLIVYFSKRKKQEYSL